MSENMSQDIKTEPTDSTVDSERTMDSGASSSGAGDSTSSTQSATDEIKKEISTIRKDIESSYTGQLTSEQWEVIQYVGNLLNDPKFREENNNAIFIDGVVGSGKTEVAKILCEYVERHFGEDSAIYATSYAASALNYRNGKTAHVTFNLPLQLNDDDSFWNLDDTNDFHLKKMNKLQASTLIVYDDINSVNNGYIHMLDRSFQRLMGSNRLFGGKIIIFVGDFRQLAPVDTRARAFDKQYTLRTSPVRSPIWPMLRRFYLPTYHRTSGDELYTSFLRQVGTGQVEGFRTTGITDVLRIPIPEIYTTALDDFINFIFPNEILNNPVPGIKGRAILVPRNKEKGLINNYILQHLLPGPSRLYRATFIEMDVDGSIVYGEYENEDNEIPERNLELRKGALCVVIRTIYDDDSIVLQKGEKVVVEDMLDDYIMVTRLETGLPYALSRLSFDIGHQFPLKICYAVTIHGSQGQNLSRVAVDLRVPEPYFTTAIFCHGQLHVALGRVRSAKDICLLVDEPSKGEFAFTHNMVYPDLIQSYIERPNMEE